MSEEGVFERILPESNVFSNDKTDEFSIDFKGKTRGVFKKFEYISLPFMISGRRDVFNRVLNNARIRGESFKDVLLEDKEATQIFQEINSQMEKSSVFSKQVVEYALSKAFLYDNVLSEIEVGGSLEDNLSKVVLSWNILSDFYNFEGLVDSRNTSNPFLNGSSSFIAGNLDSLEQYLPSIKRSVNDVEWNEVLIKISRLIERSYGQIDEGVNVLNKIFEDQKSIEKESIHSLLQDLDLLSKTNLETNSDVGKFFNTVIRFHNWMPLTLKKDYLKGDVYDSICVPTKKALDLVSEEVRTVVNTITDATSPKGLALVNLVDEGLIGSKSSLEKKVLDLEKYIDSDFSRLIQNFSLFGLDDNVLYTGLVGGKWKGIKLLYDAKTAFDMNFEIPRGEVVNSLVVLDYLDRIGVMDLVYKDIFSITDESKVSIIKILDENIFDVKIDFSSYSENLIVRSSMYGEDGVSNFSGTYESYVTSKRDFNQNVTEVIKSYFADEAIKSRFDVGLSHVPGISVILQEYVSGKGGVIYVSNDNIKYSLGSSADDVVMGNSDSYVNNGFEKLLEDKVLNKSKKDLIKLQSLFGNIDLEFVIDSDSNLYLTQMRPKRDIHELKNEYIMDNVYEKIDVESFDELKNLKISKPTLVSFNFLNGENVNDKTGQIMDFIREYRKNIVAIKGKMAPTAHIPNKIEGHFKIPYIMEDF